LKIDITISILKNFLLEKSTIPCGEIINIKGIVNDNTLITEIEGKYWGKKKIITCGRSNKYKATITSEAENNNTVDFK